MLATYSSYSNDTKGCRRRLTDCSWNAVGWDGFRWYIAIAENNDHWNTKYFPRPKSNSRHSPAANHQPPLAKHHSPVTTRQSPLTSHHSPITTHQPPPLCNSSFSQTLVLSLRLVGFNFNNVPSNLQLADYSQFHWTLKDAENDSSHHWALRNLIVLTVGIFVAQNQTSYRRTAEALPNLTIVQTEYWKLRRLLTLSRSTRSEYWIIDL